VLRIRLLSCFSVELPYLEIKPQNPDSGSGAQLSAGLFVRTSCES
jgi:hypothetical protein